MSDDALRLLARRDDRALARLDALASGGSPAILGRVTTTSAAPGTFFTLQPQVVTGGECEACDATFADAASLGLVAYNLGPGTLASGDKVVARFVGSRWVAGRKGSGDPPPEGCGCFAEVDIPTTLNWTYVSRRWDDFSGTVITLGTTTGTLSYSSNVTFDSCGVGPGWIGEFEYWTEGVPPDTGISALKITHCSTQLPGGQAGTRRCLWLVLLCEETDATAGTAGVDGDLGIGDPSNLFYAGKIDGNPSCLLYNAAYSMDGFAGEYYPQVAAGARAGVFIGELCEDGAIYVAYPDSFDPTYDSGLGAFPWRSYSLLTITL